MRVGQLPVLLAVVLALVTAPAAQAPAAAVTTDRQQGPDRFGTAAAVSAARFSPGTSDVVVVSGISYADALTAAPLAEQLGGPLLLVERDAVPAATRAELRRLSPQRVWVVGGEAAVGRVASADVATYAAHGVQRLAGADRYETSSVVARQRFAGRGHEVFMASGEGFADALTGGSAAAAVGAPLLLTGRDSLPAATSVALAAVAPTRITVVGGTAAISATVESQLRSRWPDAVVRLAGGDRYVTGALVAQDTWESTHSAILASGEAFPDALTAAALGAPLLLSRPACLPTATADAVSALGVASVTAVGGLTALGDAAVAGTVCR